MKIINTCLVAALSLVAMPATAHAAVYVGTDVNPTGATTLPNSRAAQTSFLAAAGPVTTVTFEATATGAAAPLTIGNLTITGTDFLGGTQNVLATSQCIYSLCGGNTTTGGSKFYYHEGGSSTLTFATPVSAVGFFLGGIQIPGSISYTSDTGVQVVNFSGSANTSYIGVTGSNITSVALNASGDFLSVDDISYAGAAVPEPASWAMMILGMGAVGFALRSAKRRSSVKFDARIKRLTVGLPA